MVKTRTTGEKVFAVINTVILVILAFSCFYPLWYSLCLSISDKAAANSGMVTFYPIRPTLASYQEIMKDSLFFNSFWISIQRTVLGIVITMLALIMMAYPLSKSKREYRPRSIIMWIVIFCMLFNGGTIPWYITVRNYGLIDSIWALVLGGSLPMFNLILMVNFFRGLPADLEEAAYVDGAGPWTILFRIVVPCSVPVLATIILFTGVYHWNEFFNGLVLTSGQQRYPLQTYIQQLVVNISNTANMTQDQIINMQRLSNKSLNAAKVFIAMIPMLCVYPFLQRYFVSGIMLGAVKE
ncbi:MAG: carbohydrate ABC transporter permease [Spirochaetaceae bacterium]|jgi:multiple sugar transport system permease protein/putative aldouronate transport system permease protein|nr:carbohydrate ABC transporter permease [Spirochaetaceae bacterium]